MQNDSVTCKYCRYKTFIAHEKGCPVLFNREDYAHIEDKIIQSSCDCHQCTWLRASQFERVFMPKLAEDKKHGE